MPGFSHSVGAKSMNRLPCCPQASLSRPELVKVLTGKKKGPIFRALSQLHKQKGRLADTAEMLRVAAFGDYPLGVFRQLLSLREQFEGFDHLRVGLGPDLEPFVLAEGVNEDLALDGRMQPIAVLKQVRLGVSDLLLIQEFAEVVHHIVVHFKILTHLMASRVALGEVEEGVMLQESILEAIGLLGRDLDIRSNSAAAVYRTPTVSQFDFAVDAIFFAVAIVIIVVKRNPGVVALDKASAGRVVLGGCQREAGIL